MINQQQGDNWKDSKYREIKYTSKQHKGKEQRRKILKSISLHANVNTTYQNLWDGAEKNERNLMYHILQKNKYLKSKIEVFILHQKNSKLNPKSSAEV